MNDTLPHTDARAFAEMMKVFEELSLRERLARTLRGLNQPRTSGDYKFAVLQIQRLSGPFLAIALPLLVIALLLRIDEVEPTALLVQPVNFIQPRPRRPSRTRNPRRRIPS